MGDNNDCCIVFLFVIVDESFCDVFKSEVVEVKF